MSGAAPALRDAPGGQAQAVPLTVLCVDDEPNILAALQRALRGPQLRVLTAAGGAEALQVLDGHEVDLVISDMRMPGMDGAQLLEAVRQRWPATVRMLLTGHADMASTVAAVNRGGISRYVAKPWDAAELLAAVEQVGSVVALRRERDALAQLTRRQNAELQSLNLDLEQRVARRTCELERANTRLHVTYLQCIKAFVNLLELRSGALAGHGRRVADLARNIARAMKLDEQVARQVFIAGLVHDIGLLGMPDQLLDKPSARYTVDEQSRYRDHTVRGEQTLLALEDMHELMPLVRSHHEHYDGRGFPEGLAGSAIALGARILAVADAYDELIHGSVIGQAVTVQEARTLVRQRRGDQFDPEVVDAFLHLGEAHAPLRAARLVLPSSALEADMVLAEDLRSAHGVVMLTAGHRLTAALIARMRDFEERQGVALEVCIQRVPLS